jgi:DNA-binding transcriptional MocR family regulator
VTPEARRRDIVAVAEKHDVIIVEDEILKRLLHDPPLPISSLAPERSYLVASTSKVIAGGLRVGFVAMPSRSRQNLVDGLGATTLMISPLPVEIVATWIGNGTAEKIVKRRIREITERQRMAREILEECIMATKPTSYHIWLHLPEPWTSTGFTMEAQRRGVGVAPAELFAVEKPKPLNAVRICLATAANRQVLQRGLEVLASILEGSPRRTAAAI